MKINELTRELNRVKSIVEKAEKEDMFLVHSDYGDQLTKAIPTDPYPIFFSPSELIQQINEGNWYCVNWYVADKKEMKRCILNRINELQERLIKL